MKANTKERRAYIQKYIEQFGLWRVPYTSLAEKWGVSTTTIYKDLKAIVRNTDYKEELPNIMHSIYEGYKTALYSMFGILADKKRSKEHVQASQSIAKLNMGMIETLEKFGIKDIVNPVTDQTIRVIWAEKEEDNKKA